MLEILEEYNYHYDIYSKEEERRFLVSTVGYGIDMFIHSNYHLNEMKLLENHVQILEANDFLRIIKENELNELPKTFIIVSPNSTLQQKICSHQLNQCSIIFVQTKDKVEDLYVRFLTEINEEKSNLDQLISNDYIYLTDLLTQDVDISEIEAAANKILGNPMIITDESYKVIAYSKNSEVDDPIWSTIVENNYCPYNIVQMTDYNQFWHRLKEQNYPLFVDSDDFSPYIRRVVAEIQSAGKTKGFIALLEKNKKISELDLHILQMVAKVISIKLKEKDSVSKALRQMESDFISDLLHGKMKNEKMIQNRALSLEWDISNWYAVLCVDGKENDRYIGSILEDIKNKLNRLFQFCVYCFDGEQAFYILGFNDRAKLQNQYEIKSIMSNERLICSAGLAFPTLQEVNKSYIQAKNCSNIVRLYTDKIPKKSFYSYNELAVYDLLLQLYHSVNENYNFSSQLLETLANIDQKEDTEYVLTLRHFFTNNQNVASTANSMYLHRNTINYRLNKIRKLLGEDFDHPSIRLYLNISIIMMDLGLFKDIPLCN